MIAATATVMGSLFGTTYTLALGDPAPRRIGAALLPAPFGFVSPWLPSGATVTSLRDAIYFPGYEHARPIVVLTAWAAAFFGAMLVASYGRGTSPGGP